jgi:hypothetical protein
VDKDGVEESRVGWIGDVEVAVGRGGVGRVVGRVVDRVFGRWVSEAQVAVRQRRYGDGLFMRLVGRS